MTQRRREKNVEIHSEIRNYKIRYSITNRGSALFRFADYCKTVGTPSAVRIYRDPQASLTGIIMEVSGQSNATCEPKDFEHLLNEVMEKPATE